MNRLFPVVVFMAALVLAACSESSAPTTTTMPPPVEKPRVVATTSQIGDFVRVIGADLVDLTVIGAGADPHGFVPTANDITAIATADVVIRNGVGYEKWFDAAYSNSDSSGVVIDASNGVQLRTETVAGRRVSDPHIWASVVNARQMVQNVTTALSNVSPDDADTFTAIQRGYDSQLAALSSDVRSILARTPRAPVVTTHDGLGYFIDEFDLIDGGSVLTGYDAAGTDPATIDPASIEALRTRAPKVIFGDATVGLQVTASAAAQIGARAISGSDVLYVDALGPESGNAATYLDMMRHNANAIARNLS